MLHPDTLKPFETLAEGVALDHDSRVEDYLPLEIVLCAAYRQASGGKGRERHGAGDPFEDQPIITIGQLLKSPDGEAYQVMKKLREGIRMHKAGDTAAGIIEALGAINYVASVALLMSEEAARRDGAAVVMEPPLKLTAEEKKLIKGLRANANAAGPDVAPVFSSNRAGRASADDALLDAMRNGDLQAIYIGVDGETPIYRKGVNPADYEGADFASARSEGMEPIDDNSPLRRHASPIPPAEVQAPEPGALPTEAQVRAALHRYAEPEIDPAILDHFGLNPRVEYDRHVVFTLIAKEYVNALKMSQKERIGTFRRESELLAEKCMAEWMLRGGPALPGA